MSTSNKTTVENALPIGGVPATGTFLPVDNVVPGTFNTPTETTDPPYNAIFIDAPDKIVGTSTTPYLPMALPSYIPTLYENMYHVQTNLKDEILTSGTIGGRDYPTINAVKNYVATQLSGVQLLVPEEGVKLSISTGLTTSFLTASSIDGSLNVSLTIIPNPETNVDTQFFATTYDFETIATARNGSEKLCINASNIGVTSGASSNPIIIENIQLFLSKSNQHFIVNGQRYKYYVPACLGDTLNLVQFIDPNTQDELFFVITYGGLFSQKEYYPLPSSFTPPTV